MRNMFAKKKKIEKKKEIVCKCETCEMFCKEISFQRKIIQSKLFLSVPPEIVK